MSEPRQRSFRRGLRTTARAVLFGALAAGVGLRLTVRDGIFGLSTIYYALPLGVLTALAALPCLVALRRRRGRAAAAWLVVTLMLAAWWYSVAWVPRSEAPRDVTANVRVMVWNVCRGFGGWERLGKAIEREQPDVAALIEAGPGTAETRAIWRRVCPSYDVSLLGGGIVCLTRGVSGEAVVHDIDEYSQVRQLDIELPQASLTCVLVDVHSSPLYDRAAALHAIARSAEALSDRPTLVLGDFNTPSDSVHLQALRARHVNAFETAGEGYAPTWPVIAPVLTLDQLWGNERVRFVDCRQGWSWLSDHRPVVADAAIARPGATAAAAPR